MSERGNIFEFHTPATGSPVWGYSSGMSISGIPTVKPPIARLGVFGELEVYSLLGYQYPSGSIKYRVARAMINDGESKHNLGKDMGIAERSTGNTGIALAYEGSSRGHPVRIFASKETTDEAKELMRQNGAEVVEVNGYFEECGEAIRSLMNSEPGRWYWPDQFNNRISLQSNVELGYEISRELTPDIFMASAGTGSTITGVGGALKDRNPDLLIYLVMPTEEFSVPGVDNPDAYEVPAPLFDKGLVRLREPVSEEEAIEGAQRLHSSYGHPVGVSSGAVFRAAEKIADIKSGKALIILPDHRNRYTHLLEKNSGHR